jgi:hypothetical protein
MFLDVATKQPALPLHIRDIPGSFLDLEVDGRDRIFRRFPPSPRGKGEK